MPSLAWGHGMTPYMRDRPGYLLAVAWGPLIQILVLIDHEDTENPFVLDGYYILRNIDQQVSKINKTLPEPNKVPRRAVRFSEFIKPETINQLMKLQEEEKKEDYDQPFED